MTKFAQLTENIYLEYEGSIGLVSSKTIFFVILFFLDRRVNTFQILQTIRIKGLQTSEFVWKDPYF
jgi:hypothetical protein